MPIGSVFRLSTPAQGAPSAVEGRRGDQWAVFVVDGDRARLQAVQLGQRNDREGQVVGGLTEGQTVVLHPPDTLIDGARVTIRGASSFPAQ